jgi:hypothetical protein
MGKTIPIQLCLGLNKRHKDVSKSASQSLYLRPLWKSRRRKAGFMENADNFSGGCTVYLRTKNYEKTIFQ